MKLRQLIFAFLLNSKSMDGCFEITLVSDLRLGLAAAASCGSSTIASQSDADVLNTACATVTGDVILASNAAGVVNFDGIQVIDGNLVSDSCSSNCSSFTSLSSSTLTSVSQNITFQNLPGLGSVSFPGLQNVGGQFYLDSLPNLQNLSIHSLSSVGQFHLGFAAKLVSMDLIGMQKVTGQDPSIEVISIGLSALQGLNVDTKSTTPPFSPPPPFQPPRLAHR
jgi:hypothetical protein